MPMFFFWVVTPCLHGVTTQKNNIVIRRSVNLKSHVGENVQNHNGKMLWHFSKCNAYRITNIFLRHKETHEVTSDERSRTFIIDYIINCKSCSLGFAHPLYFNKMTTFRKLDILPSSGKKEGQKT
jgi:hypothetical protein